MARLTDGMGRKAAAALCLAFALAGCGQDEDGGARKARAGTPACKPEDLALRMMSQEPGITTYRFQNLARPNCVLQGFPTVVLSGPDGRPLEGVTVRTVDPLAELNAQGIRRRASKVVLRQGRRAAFSIRWPEARGAACRSFVKVTATPPGADWGLDVAQDGKLCGDEIVVSTFWYDASDVK
jgi:hypothetical protein